MAAERFFAKVTNDVLQATEQVANRFEESLTLIFGNSAAKDTAAGSGGASAAERSTKFHQEFDNNDQDDLEEALRDNPLQGMADSVLSGIMGGQVSTRKKYRG